MTISPLASISPGARIGANATIGPFTVVHDDVVIGDDCTIESHCVVGLPTALAEGRVLELGDGALVRSHSVLYQGSRIGPGLRTGHHVTIREGLVAGRSLQVGTATDIQGSSVFGDFVRTHSSVFVAQGATIGSYVWLSPGVILTDDPHPPSDGWRAGVTVEDFAVIAARATVMPGIRVGTRSLVAAGALVTRDVAPDTVVAGVPARLLCPTSEVLLRDGSGRPAYPWMRHFHRGYPPEVVERWVAAWGGLPPWDGDIAVSGDAGDPGAPTGSGAA